MTVVAMAQGKRDIRQEPDWDPRRTADTVAVAMNFYRAAREELVERVKLRDQVLLIYLGFVGAVIGASLSNNAWREIPLIIPFLGLGCAILVSQHNAVIGALIAFINKELNQSVRSLGIIVPEFVSSSSFKTHSRYSNLSRSVGHSVVILIPEVAALGINVRHALNSPFPMGPAWWFGIAFVLFSVIVISHSHAIRSHVYNATDWN